MTRRARTAAGVVAAVALAAGLTVTAVHTTPAPPAPGSSSGMTLPPPVYSRAEFGPTWPTIDGCDARNRTLRRDLTAPTVAADGCTVLAGTLHDPYTGTTIPFLRGTATSGRVQIDHVVPLHLAWQDGAWQWTPELRRAFANDPRNLLAVDGPSNEAKGDSGPSGWLPPNPAERCPYATALQAVIVAYPVTLGQPDRHALDGLLSACKLS